MFEATAHFPNVALPCDEYPESFRHILLRDYLADLTDAQLDDLARDL